MLKTTLFVNSKWRLYLYGSTAAEECDKEDDAAHHDQEHRRVEEVVTKEVQVFSKQIIIALFFHNSCRQTTRNTGLENSIYLLEHQRVGEVFSSQKKLKLESLI